MPGGGPGPEEELRTAAAHVVVGTAALDEGTTVEPGDAHHLARVLRLRPGEVVTLTDGAGRWRRCRWRGPAPGPGSAQVEPDGPVHMVAAAEHPVTVGFAPVKGDRPEWAVQKLTELGVDRIIIVRAVRSVVRWEGDRASQQLERLHKVVRDAVMQSRRCHVPRLVGVCDPAQVPGAALAHFGGGPVSLRWPVVLVGPEGGWAASELDGAPTVSLGPLVLRTETAALAAAVLLTALRTHEDAHSVATSGQMG